MMRNKIKSAFTLLEVTIVIMVSILLLTISTKGAVIVQYAKAQAIINEHFVLRVAMSNFYKLYQEMPGNMSDFSDKLGAGFYNGNGDGKIDIAMQYDSVNLIYYNESYQLWAHLFKANFLPVGPYTGQRNSSTVLSKIKVNIPQSKLSPDVGYTVSYKTYDAIDGNLSVNRHNVMELADFTEQDADGRGIKGAITPLLMSIVDAKIDDGKPLEGVVFGVSGTGTLDECCNSACTTLINGKPDNKYYTNVTYIQEKRLKSCIAVFILTEF